MFLRIVPLVLLLGVTLAQEPTLNLLPGNIHSNLGQDVLVSCTASVPEPDLITNMQWTGPGGSQIPNIDNTVTTLDGLVGKNQLDLQIKQLTVEDVGEYECSANYAGNQKLTKTVQVRYFRDLDFQDTEKVQTPVLFSDAKIRCVVTSEPAPNVDWSKDNAPLKQDSRIIQQSDGILIKNITEQDEGVYRCRARVPSLGRIDSLDIQVEVHIPPEITGPPKNASGVEKESAAFECIAKGKPAPKYTWVNPESEVLNGKEGYFVDDVTGELQILDLRPDHTGTYRCKAENPAGEVFSEAFLRVLTKPKIEQHLNITVAKGKDMEMRCILSGDPLPQAVFKKETNEENFQNGNNDQGRIEVRQSEDDQGRRVGSLIITEVKRSDDGLYTCSGVSTGGETVSWGHITVEYEPTFEDQPQDEFWSWEQQPVNLTCLATSIPNATIQWFLREQPIREEDPNLNVLARGPNGFLNVRPVDGSYFDTYTCRATNTLGMASHEVSLRQVQKPGPVASTKEEKTTATTVSWSVQEPLDNGGRPVLGYTVQFRLTDRSWDEAHDMFWSKGSTYIVDHLTPQATYVFRFAARNDVGDGEWSGEKSVEMPARSSPEEPLMYNLNPDQPKAIPYTNHYELQWRTPLDNGEPILSYKIVYYQVKPKGNGWEPVGSKMEATVPAPGKTTYRIEKLKSDSHYKIELRAHNKIGYSKPIDAIIKTAYTQTEPVTEESRGGNSGLVVAIVIIVLLIICAIVDVTLYFVKGIGVTAFIVRKAGSGYSEKDKEAMIEEGKLGTKSPSETLSKEKVVEEVTKEDVKDKEVTETTPMIAGETDKEAIKKEESKEAVQDAKESAAAVNEGLTKDSSV